MARQPAGSSGADRAARSPSWAGQVGGSPPVRPAARLPSHTLAREDSRQAFLTLNSSLAGIPAR